MGTWISHGRLRNRDWDVWEGDNGYDHNAVDRAIALDIRQELRNLNQLLGCHNFVRIPQVLDDIRSHTKPKRKKKRPVKK